VIARVLPPNEWQKIRGTELPAVIDDAPTDDVEVIVVEDDAGELVAGVSRVRITHLEGLWVRPDYRGNAGVWRRLIQVALKTPSRWNDSWVMAGSASDQMRRLLNRLGGVTVPMDTYLLKTQTQEVKCLGQ
jgi:hypothetical protein